MGETYITRQMLQWKTDIDTGQAKRQNSTDTIRNISAAQAKKQTDRAIASHSERQTYHQWQSHRHNETEVRTTEAQAEKE